MAVVFTDSGEAIVTDALQGATLTAEPLFGAIGTGATTFTKTSTTISTEVETRASGTSSRQTTGSTNDTYRVVVTQTATATRAVTNGGLFDASSTGNLFIGSDGLSVTLATGDSVQQTFNLQLT